jgi:hypothetical protein
MEVPLPRQGRDRLKVLRRPILKPIKQNQAQQAVGDTSLKTHRPYKLIVHVQCEEVARPARELHHVAFRDYHSLRVERQPDRGIFVEQQFSSQR